MPRKGREGKTAVLLTIVGSLYVGRYITFSLLVCVMAYSAHGQETLRLDNNHFAQLLNANRIFFDCFSVVTQAPIIKEKCQDYIVSNVVDRQSISNGPTKIKVTACPVESQDPKDKTVFIYTNSPKMSVWLCQDSDKKNAREDSQLPEAPTMIVTIVDGQAGDFDDDDFDNDDFDNDIVNVFGGSNNDDFFDGRRPRKPGMPSDTPVLLGIESAGWLPAGLISFAFDLEPPELSNNSPILFQQGVMSDDSGILVIISGAQQRIYRRAYQFGNWDLVGQTNGAPLPSTEEPFDNFTEEDKLVRALVGVFGWTETGNIPIYQMPIGKVGGSSRGFGGGEPAGGAGASSSNHAANGDTGQSQRQFQGQGSGGGGAGGGEYNPILSELMEERPSLLNQFLKEALKLLKELNREEKKLSLFHLLANVYIDAECEDYEVSIRNLDTYFTNSPDVAVRWLTVVARLFPNKSRLNVSFLSKYKEALSAYVFPIRCNESVTFTFSILHRFYLLRYSTLSNEFVLGLYRDHSLLNKYLSDSHRLRDDDAKMRESQDPNGMWPIFVDLYYDNALYLAFNYHKTEEINGWLAIFSQVLQELRDKGQEDFVNLILVGLGSGDRENVLSQMKSIAESDVAMEVDQSVDWRQVAQRAIKRKNQLEAQLKDIKKNLSGTVQLLMEATAQLGRLTTENLQYQQLSKEKQSTVLMTCKTELSHCSSEVLKTNLLELQSQLMTTEKELRETEVKMMCSVCQSSYTDPHVLPCRHMLCKECISQLVTDKRGQIKCPRCSKQLMKEDTYPVYP